MKNQVLKSAVGAMRRLALIGLILLSASLAVAAEKVFPSPAGYVNDFAGIIDISSKEKLGSLLADIEKSGVAEIAVVTIQSAEDLGFADIEEAAVRIFEEWGIGKKGKDNGILVITAIKERKVRIEVGYGLEGEIPDGAAGEIIRTGIAPYFKEKRFGDGLYNGVLLIAERIKIDTGEKGVKKDSKDFTNDNIVNIIVLSFIVLAIIISVVVNSRKRYSSMGRQYHNGDGYGGFWGSGRGGFGGGFGSFGGSDSFGGFGGGMSGGGGASGDW